jgi:hypothetical protein
MFRTLNLLGILNRLKMNKKDFIDIISVWSAVVTTFITAFMPYLQFLAIVLAIAVSIQKLMYNRKRNDRPTV